MSSCITVGVPSMPVPCSRRSEKLFLLHRDFAGEVEVLDLFACSVTALKAETVLSLLSDCGSWDMRSSNLHLWSFLAVAGLSLKFRVPTGSVFKKNYLLESCISDG